MNSDTPPTTSETPTPRTDAAWDDLNALYKLSDAEKKDFARQLERELNQYKKWLIVKDCKQCRGTGQVVDSEEGGIIVMCDCTSILNHQLTTALARVKELETKLVYEWGEDEIPVFRDNATEPHELEELVTAERCKQLVDLIVKEKARVKELEKDKERLDWLESEQALVAYNGIRMTWVCKTE